MLDKDEQKENDPRVDDLFTVSLLLTLAVNGYRHSGVAESPTWVTPDQET